MHAYSLSEQLFFGVGIWAVAAALLGLYLGRIFARAADGCDGSRSPDDDGHGLSKLAPCSMARDIEPPRSNDKRSLVKTQTPRAGSEPADFLSDSPWRREMTHRAALTALARYPRLDDELPKAIYPFAAERERILMRRRTKGVH